VCEIAAAVDLAICHRVVVVTPECRAANVIHMMKLVFESLGIPIDRLSSRLFRSNDVEIYVYSGSYVDISRFVCNDYIEVIAE